MADKAGRYLFDLGYGNHGTPEARKTFDDLTNAQKLEILDAYLSIVLRDCAKTQNKREYDRAYMETDFDMGILPKP